MITKLHETFEHAHYLWSMTWTGIWAPVYSGTCCQADGCGELCAHMCITCQRSLGRSYHGIEWSFLSGPFNARFRELRAMEEFENLPDEILEIVVDLAAPYVIRKEAQCPLIKLKCDCIMHKHCIPKRHYCRLRNCVDFGYVVKTLQSDDLVFDESEHNTSMVKRRRLEK